MPSSLVHLNGSIIPAEQAFINTSHAGFLYGFGLFETMRAYQGKVFMLSRHLERLAAAAEQTGIVIDAVGLSSAVRETIEVNQLSSARVRITVSAGSDFASLVKYPEIKPDVLITAVHYQPLPEKSYRKGFRAITSSIFLSSSSPLQRFKTTSYMDNVMARREAERAGVDEAVFLNEKGNICETSTANIFLADSNTLVTPSLASGVLPGITRRVVLEMAENSGIDISEREVSPSELRSSGEAFLTNSIMEIMPLVSLDCTPIGKGKPGPLTGLLARKYRERLVKLG